MPKLIPARTRGHPGLTSGAAIDRPMLNVHLVFGVSVLVTNLAAGAWGAACWYARRPSVGFWYLLRVAQTVVVITRDST